MEVIIGIWLIAAGILYFWINLPGSKTRADFALMAEELAGKTDRAQGVFSETDIAGLPLPVQKYFRNCGYIGTEKMSYIRIAYKDVDFSFGKDRASTKIDYTQYNFVNQPNRIACINSSMYGVPFEGLDAYIDGSGSMKGVLARFFTLFYQTGDAMDRSSLVTFLSECLLIPAAALQDYIVWEGIDDQHARATISCYGISASGIFTFSDNGEMRSFSTNDREVATAGGGSEKVKWSVILSGYEEIDGIKKPTVYQAVWNYDDGDLVYFDGKGVITEYI